MLTSCFVLRISLEQMLMIYQIVLLTAVYFNRNIPYYEFVHTIYICADTHL